VYKRQIHLVESFNVNVFRVNVETSLNMISHNRDVDVFRGNSHTHTSFPFRYFKRNWCW